jgi:dUTP pyrophosphatase
MKIKVKKIRKEANMPFRATSGSGAYDLSANEIERDSTNKQVKIKTGLAFAIPKGYVGLIFPRSSVKNTTLRLSNSVGVIDSDYRGEVMAFFDEIKESGKVYSVGERCCQILIVKAEEIEWEESDNLDKTKRGDGGFGSTGDSMPMWWGYIHTNGHIQVKKLFNKEYVTEAKNSPFVMKTFGPYHAKDREEALKKAEQWIKEH